MRYSVFLRALTIICAVLLVGASTFARSSSSKDAGHKAAKAAEAFRDIMGAPDKSIPHEVLDNAQCIAVLPGAKKGAFILGVQGGGGVVSCRTSRGWSAPAFIHMEGGSAGLQVGGESTDYVLLFMNRDGAEKMLKSKVELGGDASVAAGPVGREAGASTDWKLNAEVLSYSRSKGAFVGAALKGVHIAPDDKENRSVYGSGVTASSLLNESIAPPASVAVYPNTLTQYSHVQARAKH